MPCSWVLKSVLRQEENQIIYEFNIMKWFINIYGRLETALQNIMAKLVRYDRECQLDHIFSRFNIILIC